jgi:hypothetical protein
MYFIINKIRYIIFISEAFNELIFMLPDSLNQIRRDSNI